MMTTLVVGANGATGKLLVEQLLSEGEKVKIIVRSTESLPVAMKDHARVDITIANLLDLSDAQLQAQVKGCCAVVSCLGHNLTFKGIYGQPRRLVKNAVQRLCNAIEATSPANVKTPVKFILMNSTGNQNSKEGETIPLSQAIVIKMIRFLVPPHADNEEAAGYLQSHYGINHNVIEWAAVRPDTLTDADLPSKYEIHKAPTRNPIFDAGKTSRINVAHFMSQLIIKSEIWHKWKANMPVIYNSVS